MCVIIHRQAGADIPYDKLELACDINPDGYGLAFQEKKGMKVIRNLDKNDPKELSKVLKKLGEREYFLHLRYATVGKVSAENSHPFSVLTKKEHGADVYMMHNGTLWDYKPAAANTDLSDTLLFTERFIRPAFLRSAAFSGAAKWHEDWFLRSLVERELKATQSTVLVFDQNLKGVVFGQKGVNFPGWWASNDYSFNKNHMRSSFRSTSWESSVYTGHENSSRPFQGHNPGGTRWIPPEHRKPRKFGSHATEFNDDLPFETSTQGNGDVSRWDNWVAEELDERDNVSEQMAAASAFNLDNLRTQYEVRKVGETINYINMPKEGAIMYTMKNNHELRERFAKMANISSLGDVEKLTEEQLVEFSTEYPRAMAQLVIDLLQVRRVSKALESAGGK